MHSEEATTCNQSSSVWPSRAQQLISHEQRTSRYTLSLCTSKTFTGRSWATSQQITFLSCAARVEPHDLLVVLEDPDGPLMTDQSPLALMLVLTRTHLIRDAIIGQPCPAMAIYGHGQPQPSTA